MFDSIKKIAQHSGSLLKRLVEDYIEIQPTAKQLVLKQKATLKLCQQATARVAELTSLEPAPEEGLIAVIERQSIKVRLRFSPERIVLHGDRIEGQLRLLGKPDLETNSIVYRSLISAWSVLLGGYIPERLLPAGVRMDGNTVYYTLPNAQLKLLKALQKAIADDSALHLHVKGGEITIQSDVAIDWKDLNFQELLQMFGNSSPTNSSAE